MSAKEEFISIFQQHIHREGADALLDYLESYHGEIGFFKEVDHDQSV